MISNEWTSEADFAAEMTNRQFAALRMRLDKKQLAVEAQVLLRSAPRRMAKNCDTDQVRMWATNGWNTEQILRLSPDLLPPEQLVNALQWAFPQAYYSAFALTLATFKTTGVTETSHTAVLRRFGELVAKGIYPACLSFTATGARPITFSRTAKSPASSTLAFDPTDIESVNTQICQFLKATRERDLRERKRSMNFKAKSGKRKRNLAETEWTTVSESLGPTSILSLLYRKRIKSNYQEIDTFLNPNINATTLFGDLIHVVSCLNLIHELTIAHAIGISTYRGLQSGLPSIPAFLKQRTMLLEEVLTAAEAD
jgi:hypothetical protein